MESSCQCFKCQCHSQRHQGTRARSRRLRGASDCGCHSCQTKIKIIITLFRNPDADGVVVDDFSDSKRVYSITDGAPQHPLLDRQTSRAARFACTPLAGVCMYQQTLAGMNAMGSTFYTERVMAFAIKHARAAEVPGGRH